MFLKNITVNNFKSIQKATVGFEDGLNIIIGKNGAGKSNLLEFIYQSTMYLTITDDSKFFRNINVAYEFVVSSESDNSIIDLVISVKKDGNLINGNIEYATEIRLIKVIDGRVQYNSKTITIKNDGSGRVKNAEGPLNEIEFLLHFTRNHISYTTPDNTYWLSQPYKFELDNYLSSLTEEYNGFDFIIVFSALIRNIFYFRFAEKGIDVNNLELNNVKNTIQEQFREIIEMYKVNYYLSNFSPIQEIRLNPNVNIYQVGNKILVENLLIDFKVNDNWVPWSYLSDGSKRLFYLITQCLSLKDGLLLIEEPELGIHPHQLYSLMNFLKEQSVDKQIIISTHSPIVLDVLNPDELSRITIAKIENTGSKFYKLTDEQLALAKEYMQDVADLSNYWLHSDLENNNIEAND